jgi:hypothetical protein
MKAAVEAMRNKEMGSYKASSVFSLPQTTIQRCVKRPAGKLKRSNKTKLGRKQVLPCEVENDMAEQCLLMERKFLSLTLADVMRLAYQLAVRNGIKNQFCTRNEKTRRKWLKNCLRRHQEISVTTAEVLRSQNRGVSLLKQQLSIFKSTNPIYTIRHNPARLHNGDETSITIVQHKHAKILGLKDKRQISSVQSAERGSLVTVVNYMSPTGHFIPPLLVFSRKYMKPDLMNGTSPGSIHACHPSGWIQSEIFA